jgi:aminoglycoside 6'-N-acetyltransferase
MQSHDTDFSSSQSSAMTNDTGRSVARSFYAFRPATRADLPLLRGWLRTPEVVRWWGDPDEQYALLEADLSEPRMVMRIVSFEGRPFAYAQDYAVDVWPQPHFESLPAGSRAIDAFIGAPDMIGRGHGSGFLRVLAERLKAEGAPAVAIDPDVDNQRARRAYARAGFRGDSVVETGAGPAVLMVFTGRDDA